MVAVAGDRLHCRVVSAGEAGADAHRRGQPGAFGVGVDELQLGQGRGLVGGGEVRRRDPRCCAAAADAAGEVVEGGEMGLRVSGRVGVGEELEGEGEEGVLRQRRHLRIHRLGRRNTAARATRHLYRRRGPETATAVTPNCLGRGDYENRVEAVTRGEEQSLHRRKQGLRMAVGEVGG